MRYTLVRYILAITFVFLSQSLSNVALAQYATTRVDGRPFTTGCSNDHCFLAVPIYITTEPENIDKAVADCANADICRAAVVALAAYAGIDPSTVNQALSVYGKAYRILSGRAAGNEHWIYVDAPPNHVFCNIAWHTWSVTPGSTVSGSFRNDRRQAVFYANVPRKRWLEGRSWTKTMVQLHSIRNGVRADCMRQLAQNEWGNVMFDENGGSALTGGKFWDVNAR